MKEINNPWTLTAVTKVRAKTVVISLHKNLPDNYNDNAMFSNFGRGKWKSMALL